MLNPVAIQGDGIAACCCARLLLGRKIPVAITKSNRPQLPTILVSLATQKLLTDIFEDRNLFAGSHLIQKRVVLWGNGTEPVSLPHSGLVMPEAALLERLWSRIEAPPTTTVADGEWTIFSSPGAAPGQLHRFGSRVAAATDVALNARCDPDACWVEALEHGWLFLLPSKSGSGILIAVGETAESLLEQSRLIRKQVAELTSAGVNFPAYPRLLDPLAGERWLACGSAAMSFDPICGEGAGNAAREAILVAAVLGFVQGSFDPKPVLDHYRSRLVAGFLRHLELCKQFYSSAPAGAWWSEELQYLEEGTAWVQQKLAAQAPPTRYRLVGFDLVDHSESGLGKGNRDISSPTRP